MDKILVLCRGFRKKIKMSSRYTNTNRFRQSLRMLFMWAWKTAGAFVRPKSMTRYLKRPNGVLKDVFHSSPS